jgi:hypothetical protein
VLPECPSGLDEGLSCGYRSIVLDSKAKGHFLGVCKHLGAYDDADTDPTSP